MPSTINEHDLGRVVKADYDYEYKSNDGKFVKITDGDEFVLIKKSNNDWWQVIKTEQKKPLYVPAGYVRELSNKRFPDHPYFKKAVSALRKSQNEKEKVTEKTPKPTVKPRNKQPLNDSNKSSNRNSTGGSERMIVITGSREDLSVFSGFKDSNKFSELRASTDSLDKFIENENPYDEVPFEPLMSPEERKKKKEKHFDSPATEKKENITRGQDDHDYENIQGIIPSTRGSNMKPSPSTDSITMGNTPSEIGFRDESVHGKENIFTHNSSSQNPQVGKDTWVTELDAETGNKYFYNPQTGQMKQTDQINLTSSVEHSKHVSPPTSPKDDVLLKPNATQNISDDELNKPAVLQRRKTSPARFKNSKRIPLARKHKKKASDESANVNNNNSKFSSDLYKRLSPKQTKSLSPVRNNWSSPVLARRQESFNSSGSGRSMSPDMVSSGQWRRERSVEGDTVYVHHRTGERWLEIFDNSSRSYYYCNELTRVTTWELPEPSQTNHRSTIFEAPPAHPMIEKQGRLNWTKLAEAGKKTRKNWIQQWVVLLANNLLFYKDQRQATVTKSSPLGKPESSCDLRGSMTSWAKDKSSKKNVFQIRTVRGLQLLLQHDDILIATEWYKSIESAINNLNQRDPVDQSLLNRKFSHGSEDEDDKKKKDKKTKKSKAPSRHGSDAKNADKVRSKLKKLIGRRPTMEMLQEKGIIKENVFGCPLQKLAEKENTIIPNFVQMCVGEVEKRGLTVDGIYRVSGNLSHVQKLRYSIDRDEHLDLSEPQWEDIHVITGALKMFLRELPEPLIPFNYFDKFIDTCVHYQENNCEKLSETRQLIKSLPKVNQETLKYLMNHFRNVVEHSSSNRMQVQNIAIVFGPTLLLKPPIEPNTPHHPDPSGSNMAVYMMYQNQIVDYMLTEFDNLFK